jgi:hypothetical protein
LAGWLALLCARVCLLPEEAIQSPKKISATMMIITKQDAQQLLCDEHFAAKA